MKFRAFIQRHPIVSYFCMVFTISWGGAFLVVAPELLRGEAISTIQGLLMFPIMLLGPSIAGCTMTAIVDGRKGLRALLSRMGRWRVGVRWYAVLLIPPTLTLMVLLTMKALVSPVYTPHLMLLGIVYGLTPGFLEEIGWTGYVFPKMQAKLGTLPAGLLLGAIWGLWHAPVVDFLGAAYPHGSYWLPFYLAFIAMVMAVRILIIWLYRNTNSVLLPQLLHGSFTGFLVILSPAPITPAQETLWYATYAVALWIAVAFIVKYSKSFVRQPAQQPAQVQAMEPTYTR
ncbi:MAG TPA: CPBP family intramembrane glutamic endopeptidase [Ktedonobacteraceae bacterium]|nr:CPBP family intramembrane glutamic endopeptidase [Ktedonobacteraceae bacterium]